MNREQRRKAQKQQIMSRYRNGSPGVDEMLIRKALDKGIMLGFETACYLLQKVCKQVSGIGETRTKLIIDGLGAELERLKKEAEDAE